MGSRSVWLLLSLILAFMATPAPAQSGGEIIVTASRREASAEMNDIGEDDAAKVPAVGLRRTADYAVWFVNITGDTRDADRRHQEIYDMLKNAVQQAARSGPIELGTGTYVVEPLTLANYRNVPLTGAGRPDSERASFIVNPDQYRQVIVDLVAADAKSYAAKFGPEYRVEMTGIDKPVEWSRASLTEVLLYVPYAYKIVPTQP